MKAKWTKRKKTSHCRRSKNRKNGQIQCKYHYFIANVLICHCRFMKKASVNQSELVVQEMSTKVCVYLYPVIQFCADSGRLCLFQAPRPALCAGRCGPDDQHIVVGRRERCVRREDAWRVPSQALRRTMLVRQQGEKIREEKKIVEERVRRKF